MDRNDSPYHRLHGSYRHRSRVVPHNLRPRHLHPESVLGLFDSESGSGDAAERRRRRCRVAHEQPRRIPPFHPASARVQILVLNDESECRFRRWWFSVLLQRNWFDGRVTGVCTNGLICTDNDIILLEHRQADVAIGPWTGTDDLAGLLTNMRRWTK